MMDLSPIILENELVRLVPLLVEYREELLVAAQDGALWNLWYTSVPSPETIDAYLATALQQQQDQTSLPFAIIVKSSNKIIGSTRYCNIDLVNKRLEIGYTWYAKSYQKTGINTACKYLLLQNAFENYHSIAVEFRTHWHNHPSRNAILRLGAKQDGVLRNHRLGKNGVMRDTVVFSIIASEWPVVKKSLEYKITR